MCGEGGVDCSTAHPRKGERVVARAVGEGDGGVRGGDLEVGGGAVGGDAGDGAGDARLHIYRAERLGEVEGRASLE